MERRCSVMREIIKLIMLSQDWEVEDRTPPKITVKIVNGGGGSYCPSTNIITLGEYSKEVMAHELCHSLQSVDMAQYVRPEHNRLEYINQEVERQAYCIGAFFKFFSPKYTPWDKLDKKPSRKYRLLINKLMRELTC